VKIGSEKVMMTNRYSIKKKRTDELIFDKRKVENNTIDYW